MEEAGIPTVGIYVEAFRSVAEDMSLPRTVITAHPFGRPLGPAGRPERHRAVVEEAFDLLESAPTGPAIRRMPGQFEAGQ